MKSDSTGPKEASASLRLLPRLFASVGIAGSLALIPAVHAAHASGSVTLSPAILTFPNAVVGGPCQGSGCTYAEVTVANNTDATVTLVTATASANFFPTYGGTCNVPDAFSIPAGASCTFQWGFKPARPGMSAGTGTITFGDGETPSVLLVGSGSPH